MNKEIINILDYKIKDLSNGKSSLYSFTSKELRKIGAKQFKEGDIIKVSRYYIHIEYGQYDIPSLCTWIEDNNFKSIDCIPGSSKGFTPYYIDDFKNR
jgi:hypothetical protein